MLHRFSTAVIHRLRYRHGFPFITSVVLAVVTISRCQPSRATSIWTFALLALISTAFALLCGGRFRTFFIAIAVTPPFLFLLLSSSLFSSIALFPKQSTWRIFPLFRRGSDSSGLGRFDGAESQATTRLTLYPGKMSHYP